MEWYKYTKYRKNTNESPRGKNKKGENEAAR